MRSLEAAMNSVDLPMDNSGSESDSDPAESSRTAGKKPVYRKSSVYDDDEREISELPGRVRKSFRNDVVANKVLV